MSEVLWENHPETKLFVTEMDRGVEFTMLLGCDRLSVHLTYQQTGKLMEALSMCLTGASFEGRWEVTA